MARRHWHPKHDVLTAWKTGHWAEDLPAGGAGSHWALKHFVGQHYHDTHWFGADPALLIIDEPEAPVGTRSRGLHRGVLIGISRRSVTA